MVSSECLCPPPPDQDSYVAILTAKVMVMALGSDEVVRVEQDLLGRMGLVPS